MQAALQGRRRVQRGLVAVGVALAWAQTASAQDRVDRRLRIEVGGSAQYSSGGLALFSVRLDRWSPGEVDLRCQLDARIWNERVTLGPAHRTGQHDGAGAWRYALGVPLRVPVGAPPALCLPRGRHRVRCDARVVGSEERAEHEALVDFPAIEGMLPDIRVREGVWFEATDCTHGAAPVATQPLCVSVYVDGNAGYGVPAAQCVLDGVALGPGPTPRRAGRVSLRLERPNPGPHTLDCVLSLTGPAGHEADLSNNAGSGRIVVRPTEADWRYDLAITAFDAATHEARVPAEYRGQSTPQWVRGVGLGVVVRNRGGDPVERAVVTCRLGDAVLLGTLGPLGPGAQRRVEVVGRTAPVGGGEATCQVTSVAPGEVPDRTPGDNTRRGRVRHGAAP